ncbi:hypothetical protein TYRP_005092 [Tyrophagus putrescentiae]|nr:hypothetical protein TYRP_005092 [Tyrophagus putrescentiae]
MFKGDRPDCSASSELSKGNQTGVAGLCTVHGAAAAARRRRVKLIALATICDVRENGHIGLAALRAEHLRPVSHCNTPGHLELLLLRLQRVGGIEDGQVTASSHTPANLDHQIGNGQRNGRHERGRHWHGRGQIGVRLHQRQAQNDDADAGVLHTGLNGNGHQVLVWLAEGRREEVANGHAAPDVARRRHQHPPVHHLEHVEVGVRAEDDDEDDHRHGEGRQDAAADLFRRR